MTLVSGWTVGRQAATRGPDGVIQIPAPPALGARGVPGPYVYDTQSALTVPAVSRAVQLYAGFAKQMPIDAYRGYDRIAPTPRICNRPDPDRGGSWFVQVSVEDYLLSGNAISLVTSRGVDGWPLTVMWLPAVSVTIMYNPYDWEQPWGYFYLGESLPLDDVIHVRRGADRFFPVRGVGVIETHLSTLDRIAMEEEYERSALAGGAVPSVAVIAPQPHISQEVADEAKARWADKFAGPQREPVFLPNGTQVIPLAWSPSDTQLDAARQMSLVDVALMFNLDGYWLNAPVSGMTYRTAGPQYQQALRTSLEPVLADFEDAWSDAWLPRGTNIRFRRSQLLREDLATSTTAAVAAVGAGIMTIPEARVEIGLPPAQPGAPASTMPATTTNEPAADVASPDDPNAQLPEGQPGGT